MPALDLLTSGDYKLALDTTKMGLVENALSQLTKVTTKADFACCLCKGLCAYLESEEDKNKLAKQIYLLCTESPLDPRRPLDSYYDQSARTFVAYKLDTSVEFTPAQVRIPSFPHHVDLIPCPLRSLCLVPLWLRFSKCNDAWTRSCLGSKPNCRSF